MHIDLRAPVQLGESAWWIPIRSARTGRVYGSDAEVVIGSGALDGRLASRDKTLRGWLGYPVDRVDRAIGRHIEVLGVDR